MSVHRNQSSRARDNRNGATILGRHGNYPDGEGQRRGRGGGDESGGGFSSNSSQFQPHLYQHQHQQNPYHSNAAGAGAGSYSHSTSLLPHSPHSNLFHSSSASDSRQQLQQGSSQRQQPRQPQQQQYQQQYLQEPKLSYVQHADLIPPPSPTYFEMVGPHRQSMGIMALSGDGSVAPLTRGATTERDFDRLEFIHFQRANEEPKVEKNALPENISWHQRLSIWMINDGSRVFFGLWVLIHVCLFGLAFFNYQYSDNFVNARAMLGLTLPIARGAALVLHVDSGMILFPVCRTLISWLRSTPLNRIVPFDKAIAFHKAIAWSIVFFTIVHTISHYINFWKMSKADPQKYQFWNLMFVSGPGLTGHFMLLFLIVMVVTSMPSVRKAKFEVFWYWHHLFLVFFGVFSIHGAFCLLIPDRPPYCKDIASFWKYWIASGTIYLLERMMREWRASQKTIISRVILHPSHVVEIQMKKDNCKALAGQYIFLCCPEVSLWQWHPFTLTNAPEEDYLSVHIRVLGDFTKELSQKLGCDVGGVGEWEENLGDRNGLVTVLPRVMIDGPFGAASEDVFKYEVTVLVGAGIGVTPFASVLKSIWYRVNYPTKATKLHKVYFFWICRDKESFEWFQSLLLALESQDLNHFIEIHTFLTGRLRHSEVGNLMLNEEGAFADTVTGLRARTCFGRPNLEQEFDRIRKQHQDTDIGVFFCGPKKMGKELHACCTKFSSGTAQFVWHKENF
ncbi:NADPH oxidase 2 [Entomortierella parvispora]|uniref:NADPH oxidase 2 n=1 Tax=Entomortierella parvispora TaxID=205924 RepID=A0A9P3LWV6_9FUNG|nr:NADPH oxidase 2 [Entomortierella parvispora]